jgi:phosphate-selective porin OprO and OprP
MPVRNGTWPSAVSALGIVLLGAAVAAAQYPQPTRLPDTGPASPVNPDGGASSYGVPADAPAVASPASYLSGEDLASRVAELEASLKKMQTAEAAAKKKADEKPLVKLGGRLQFDAAAFSQDAQNKIDLGNYENGVEIRRARLEIEGAAFEVFDYRWQFSFLPDGTIKAEDAYLSVNELPWLGHVRAGRFKEPFSLEELTSSNYITFMERGNPNVFALSRHLGVMAFDWSEDENATWAIGAFTTYSGMKIQDDDLATSGTGRLTWLPWYDEATEGRGLLHTGIAYSYRDAWEHEYLGDIRPAEAHLGAVYDAGLTNVDYVHLLGTELAWVYGPLSIQSEYIASFVRGNEISDEPTDRYNTNSFYVFASYFLTGESRPYKRDYGVFDRVKPFENFFHVRDADGFVRTGKGAWEVAYRWSWIDLSDGPIQDGMWSNHTIGLNWYLTAYFRIMFNYVHSTVNPDFNPGHPDSSVDVFEMRTQITF